MRGVVNIQRTLRPGSVNSYARDHFRRREWHIVHDQFESRVTVLWNKELLLTQSQKTDETDFTTQPDFNLTFQREAQLARQLPHRVLPLLLPVAVTFFTAIWTEIKLRLLDRVHTGSLANQDRDDNGYG